MLTEPHTGLYVVLVLNVVLSGCALSASYKHSNFRRSRLQGLSASRYVIGLDSYGNAGAQTSNVDGCSWTSS